MIELIFKILPLFLIIGIGSILRITKIAKGSWVSDLNNFAYYVGFPALIFNSFISLKNLNLNIFFISSIILVIITLIFFLILKNLKMKKKISNTYLVCGLTGNVAYLGFPVLTALIPNSEGSVSLIVASYLLVLFTLVLYLIDNKKGIDEIKKLIKNPLLISIVLGLFFAKTNVTIPNFIDTSVKMLANSASPVALTALGIFIVQKIKFDSSMKHALIITGIKLILLPLTFFFISKFYFPSYSILILEAAMPVAITPFALSERYPLDKKIIVYSLLISTIFSVVTLPIISTFLL